LKFIATGEAAVKRSRDNLPNPTTLRHEPYFPRNAPAIGDLMTMFHFPLGQFLCKGR
jgi:hypothetical protein